ncbi:MAG TPA: carboxypeptidase regulatory-like domain-containing protein [Terriglobia bacterium]|nr:carboxypeptidase regulatory-like domain-containing protein [Terriglobia bacterium]
MSKSRCGIIFSGLLVAALLGIVPASAQQSTGGITGTLADTSGAVIPGAMVNLKGLDTGLLQSTETNSAGSYQFSAVPIGRYAVTFIKDGFDSQVHSPIVVQAQRTTTVDGSLPPGKISTTVTVSGTPMLNKVDTTNGYVLSSATIMSTPLGTGSFTQLAVLSPGVNADLLSGSGSNAGLGNLDIWANGQRDSSNSFSFNGINSNNIFNGKSSSFVAENRFDLNTGESFLAGGQISTNTSVYDAIGQGLPTPPPETIQEMRVNTSMYDASEGANSGAHIELLTKSGTNDLHGTAYDYVQNNIFNAAPFFFNADPAIPLDQKVPALHRNVFGATIGGPIKKDKLFFFGSYQGVRDHDQFNGFSQASVPIRLTNDRSAATLAQQFGLSASQINPAALKLMNFKLPNGQYLVPTPNITNPTTAAALGFDAVIQGAPSTFAADQINGNLDYVVSDKDRMAFKYYYQNDPTTNPFAVSNLLGFGQTLQAGSQVVSLDNTTIMSPTVTWEQKIGFTRQIAYATTTQPLTPADAGINLFGSNIFPGLTISTASQTTTGGLSLGPASNFSDAGTFQNQFSANTTLNWIRGRHSFSFGFEVDRNQLNIVNNNSQLAALTFSDFPSFLTGTLRLGEGNSVAFAGSTNRYYRANQIGAYAQDDFKLKPNLTVDLGLRYDYDGPLTEAHGMLTNFDPRLYNYNAATDTIVNTGLVLAGNSPFATHGVSNSTLFNNQYGIAPRVGFAWSPHFVKNLVVRAGYGIYYDRGEFFTEFSPSAGFGFNGPFGVTLEPPFVLPILSTAQDNLSNPFGSTAPTQPTGNPKSFVVPNMAGLQNGDAPFLFGGYDPANSLPYSENWELDLQWQPTNTLMMTLGYVGNHGIHELLPIPFNQSQIATPQHPIHGQSYSYGYNAIPTETAFTADGGNTDLRVPYIGYSTNSVYYEAEGISNYDALQFSVNKRLSHGLQVNGSYTYSHALDEGSGLQLFYNGNNPLDPSSAYGTAGFDRTHVLTVSYLYQLPNVFSNTHSAGARVLDGWSLSGIGIFESGTPYSVIDFTGGVGSIFYSTNDYITNPLVPLASGQTYKSVQLQGTTGINAGQPVLNSKGFTVPLLQPGQGGVPPCVTVGGAQQCDTYETGFGPSGRNIFRSPFQPQMNFSVMKDFKLSEKFTLNYRADFFNLFNWTSFDAPNNNVQFNPYYANPPYNPVTNTTGYVTVPFGHLGLIQHTLGSPRFIQMALHLNW